MNQYKDKNAACEVRDKYYTKTWTVELKKTPMAAPGFCCYASFCTCCASYQNRKRALHNDMSRYLCCGGFLPCSGRCGEQKCPEFCLATETVCCFAQSVASTRWMIQDEMQIQNTKCDNCLIATMVTLQYLSCIISCLACIIQNDGLNSAARIIDCIADAVWCSVCGCMQTQAKLQLDARDADPSLVQPLNPYMAPVFQSMGVPINNAPASYPPPSSYPPSPAAGGTSRPPLAMAPLPPRPGRATPILPRPPATRVPINN